MYSSGGDGGAANLEKVRQAKIDNGMKNINRMFDGGTYGSGLVKTYKPGETYYNAQGQVWTPPKGADPATAYQGAIANNLLFSKTGTSAGYGDDFYKKRADDYLSYATPQVMDQYQTTKNNLAYSLARNGILKSGAAVQRQESLGKELAKNQGTLANAAQGQVNQLRGQVQDTRNNLVNQLVTSADPSLVAQNANASTASLRAPTAFQPLGNLFNDWTNTYTANMNAKAADPSTPSLWRQINGSAAVNN